jgi:5'-3' exonuclease, C-terminal SAM fold
VGIVYTPNVHVLPVRTFNVQVTGDSSDNVPGVARIGDKRAQQLIRQYKTVENVFTHADQAMVCYSFWHCIIACQVYVHFGLVTTYSLWRSLFLETIDTVHQADCFAVYT